MPGFTSWGKWEPVRIMIRESLLSDADLHLNKDDVNPFLLEDVNTAMLTESKKYQGKHMALWETNPEEFIRGSYSACLGAMVKTITNKYGLSEEQRQYVLRGVEEAHRIIERLNDNILAIGTFSFAIKNGLLLTLYGQDFKDIYPDLINYVYIYDAKLNQEIERALREKIQMIAAEETEENREILLLHATYLGEIIQQQNTNLNFEEMFKERTGKYPDQYKADVLQQQQVVVSP